MQRSKMATVVAFVIAGCATINVPYSGEIATTHENFNSEF